MTTKLKTAKIRSVYFISRAFFHSGFKLKTQLYTFS